MAKAKKQEPAVQLLVPDDECPFELPENWIWTRLGNLGYTNIGLTYSPKDISEKTYRRLELLFCAQVIFKMV